MKTEIYTKDNCQFCVKAKALFVKNNMEYEEIDAVENRQVLISHLSKFLRFLLMTLTLVAMINW